MTAATNPPACLTRLCLRQSIRVKWLERVIAIPGYRIASTGTVLLGLVTDDPAEPGYPADAARMLEPPAETEWTHTTLGDLWAFIGTAALDWCDACPEWRAAGLACDVCGGRGYSYGPAAFTSDLTVEVAGVPVLPELLLLAVPGDLPGCHPDDPVRVGRHGATKVPGPTDVLLIRGPGFAAVVAGCELTAATRPPRAYLPGVGAFGGHQADPLWRHVVADWYEERGRTDYADWLRTDPPILEAA